MHMGAEQKKTKINFKNIFSFYNFYTFYDKNSIILY